MVSRRLLYIRNGYVTRTIGKRSRVNATYSGDQTATDDSRPSAMAPTAPVFAVDKTRIDQINCGRHGRRHRRPLSTKCEELRSTRKLQHAVTTWQCRSILLDASNLRPKRDLTHTYSAVYPSQVGAARIRNTCSTTSIPADRAGSRRPTKPLTPPALVGTRGRLRQRVHQPQAGKLRKSAAATDFLFPEEENVRQIVH